MTQPYQISNEEFAQRRQALFDAMPPHSVAIFAANEEVTRSNDTEYPFCQNKDFYYLTGFNEPEAVLALIKQDIGQTLTVLFCRGKNPIEEVWHGRRIGPEQAVTDYGFDRAFALSELDAMMPSYLENQAQLWLMRQSSPELAAKADDWLADISARVRQGVKPPMTLVDCTGIVHEMRLLKSEHELTIMRQANVISGGAHHRAMRVCKPGMFEYQIEAELHHEFTFNNARSPAYGSIVAGGDNANILHYTANADELRSGDLLLIDAGGEVAGYAADITRTFPINGKFTEHQAIIYQLVLDAQNLAIEAIKPGQTLAELNRMVGEFFTTELHKLGILQGDLASLIEENACKRYFIHGLGHWLGLDVHDVGDYGIVDKQQCRPFETGMVMTIEPGLYFPLNDDSIAPHWRGIAVRIEDNIAVIDQGHENLTAHVVKSIADIEQLMASDK
ncbi:Xaa-Pro aminopeptidase [Thalassotalea fusca]